MKIKNLTLLSCLIVACTAFTGCSIHASKEGIGHATAVETSSPSTHQCVDIKNALSNESNKESPNKQTIEELERRLAISRC